jgi:PhnB protein
MITPQFYLFFKGDCLEAMQHYAKALGGTIQGVFLNRDAATPEERMPGGDNLVMNLAMRLGDALMMASDNSEEMYERPQGFRIQIELPSAEEFDRVFAALSDAARDIPMPPGETF